IFTDGEAHRPHCTDWGHFHYHPDHHKQSVQERLHDPHGRFGAWSDFRKAKPKQYSKKQHLQQIPGGQGTENVVRNDVQKETHNSQLLLAGLEKRSNLGRVQRIGVHMHALPGSNPVDHHHAQQHRHHRGYLKIYHGFNSYLSDLLHILHSGDPQYDATENQRRNDHFNELNEAIAQRLQLYRHGGKKMTHHDYIPNSHQPLEVQQTEMSSKIPFHIRVPSNYPGFTE